MNFVKFRDKLIEHFNSMEAELGNLFTVDLDKDKFYEHYLTSYPAGTNPMFRKRTEHDCSCCRHFIKSIGNVVGIKDGQVKVLELTWVLKILQFSVMVEPLRILTKLTL